jgi:acetate CoA/acetoacetate CoA-transferase beta subunit
MDPQTIIARRIAQELKSGMVVNLGIGIPRQLRTTSSLMNLFVQSEIALGICC